MDEKFEKLKNPPIIEAVIGITARTKFDELDITKIKERATDYIEFKEMREFQQSVQLKVGTTGASEHKFEDLGFKGVRFESKDGRRKVQFNKDGLVLSIVKSYQDWQEMKSHFDELWQIYQQVAEPDEIQRIGVRYINQVVSNSTATTENDYFRTNPQKPEGLSAKLQNFIYREVYAIDDSNVIIAIVKALQSRENQKFAHVLDIDTYINKPINSEKNQIDKILAELRYFKNKAFFESITEKAKREFNQ